MASEMQYKIKSIHINSITAGDVVEHNGELKTVGHSDIKQSRFMGRTLFGDCYALGTKPVKMAVIYHALPDAQKEL